MSKTIATVGDKVVYHTTATERNDMRDTPSCNEAHHLPATVVSAWGSDTVNLKVHQDGELPDLWKTSIMRGKMEGEWDWASYHEWQMEGN